MLAPVRRGLDAKDLVAFLELPIVAVLATHGRDGRVLLSPVWHEWRDGGFNVATSAGDVKARHIARHPQASLVVAESDPPYRGVEVRCTPRLVPDPKNEVGIRLAVRYLGEERGRALAGEIGDDTVIRLAPETPDELRAWDFADEPLLRG
jgi:PPOX class probable F420-dependent enzyme